MDEAKNQMSDLEDKETKNNQSEQQEEKRIKKNEDSARSPWNNFKRSNIHIMGCQKEKKESKKLETYLKNIMTENFPNLFFIVVQVQLSPFSPYHSPPLHPSLPPTLEPTLFGFVYMFFIHVP